MLFCSFIDSIEKKFNRIKDLNLNLLKVFWVGSDDVYLLVWSPQVDWVLLNAALFFLLPPVFPSVSIRWHHPLLTLFRILPQKIAGADVLNMQSVLHNRGPKGLVIGVKQKPYQQQVVRVQNAPFFYSGSFVIQCIEIGPLVEKGNALSKRTRTFMKQ